ncbi:hypothetical protein [Flavimarina sp. Hel_I_48]|uniref:hypothetical protein n=1 Tax=Flavimarina sp. Hel_I_48 TaxID=1392488 RepID=UPI0004DEFDD2|nr:hypothetical protein [Flavimarina sp. Hel_I_48]
MKKTCTIFLLIITLSTITSCAQNRQIVKKPSFTVTDSYYTSWITNQPNNTSGMDISVIIENKPDAITLKSVFFKGQSAALNKEKETLYTAHFISARKKPDYVLSSDSKDEANNPKPRIPEKSPIPLAPDEALLVYLKDGKENYHVLKNLKDKGTKYPAEAPFNTNN